MKIWLKYLIGIVLGIATALILPLESSGGTRVLGFCAELAIRIGRYAVIPLIFFSTIAAVYTLRDTKKLYKSVGLIFGIIVAFSLLLTVIGLLSILFVRLPRIPISVEKLTETATLGVSDMFLSLFPYSGFGALLNDSCILPAFLLAILVGGACVSDKIKSKPLIAMCDACSNVFYYIMSFLMDFLAIGMIAITFNWAVTFFDILASGMYSSLLVVLTVDFLVVVCGVCPLALFLIRDKRHLQHRPFRVLYASLAPLFAAFFSGDANFTLSFLIRHGKESLGIQRRLNAISFPLFSIFSRGGVALTSVVSFVVILRSYSSLGIKAHDILWISAVSFGLSFLLASFPAGGPFIALTALCAMYGRGFEAGYLLLKPAAVIICAYAAAIDAAIAMFGSYIAATKLHMHERHEHRPFI